MKIMKLNKLTSVVLCGVMVQLVAGCANTEPLKYEESSLVGLKQKEEESDKATKAIGQRGKIPNQVEFLPPMKSENLISPQEQLKKQQYQFSPISPVKLAVENMPLRDFVHYVFGDLLGVNYVVDESIIDNSQTVSLKIDEAISAAELFELVSDLLKQKQLHIQLKQKVFYVFAGSNNGQDKDVLLGLGSNPSDVPVGADEVLQLVPLKYTSFTRISRVLFNLVQVEVYTEADYAGLSIKGKRSEVVKTLNLIQLLDQPSAKSQYIGIYPLVFLETGDFVKGITKLLTEDGFDVTNGVKFTPIEHLNSVIIHASEQLLLDRIEMWKSHLDKASDTADKKYFVFYPKRANSATLGDTLNSILELKNGKSSGSSRAKKSNTTSSPTSSSSSSSSSNKSKARTTAASYDGIVVDEQRNALVFYMEPKEYEAIYPLLNQLDVLPKQVVVEATLMEVTLTDRLNYGVEWFIKNEIDNFGTQGGLGDIAGGLTFTLNKPNLDIVMNALASTNQVNIVSNPKIMVSNGETAKLNVGTEFPAISSSVQNPTEGSGQVVQNIQYRSTGIDLSVTPTVNARNYVQLEIDQSLSEAGENELSGVDSPIILNRELSTKVLVQEGETLILAGLISENVSTRDTKVPLLGDIPILGEAFKNNIDRTVRTELILMITPKVASTESDFKLIKNALSSKFEQIELNQGF